MQRLRHLRIARELFLRQLEHVRMRREVRKPLEHRQREIRRRHPVRETLADQAGEVRLVVEHVVAGDHAAGAVAEHEHRQAGLARARQFHEQVDVALVLGELVDVVALAVGLAAAAQSRARTPRARWPTTVPRPTGSSRCAN